MTTQPSTPKRERRLRQPALARRLGEALLLPPSDDDPARTLALSTAVLEDAVREKASDIHLDPIGDGYLVRFRIDGALVDTTSLESLTGQRILRSFKSHADLDPAFALRPQDGRAEFDVGGHPLSVRVATAPGVLGEKLALRLLPTEAAHLRLDELGFDSRDHEQLTRAMHDARGMILISGPTGSGKTTTLYGLVHELKETDRCIVTIEDPVEHVVEGITQIQVNEKQSLGFAESVKGVLRLDPDIILMGEMRDKPSARAALEAADSGHVCLSTLHARDAAGTITAMRNLGLEDFEIAASVDLVVAQRLVRRLCPACRKQEVPTEGESSWLQYYGRAIPKSAWHAVGCAQCGQSGYRGRIGVFEVWSLHEEDSDLILRRSDERTLRRHIRRKGTYSLIEDHLRKVAAGITSLAEIQTIGGFGFYSSGTDSSATREEAHPGVVSRLP